MEQFNALQRQYFELSAKVERLDEAEKKRDFTIRDSAVKIGIAEGLAERTHGEISQLKLEMVALRAEMKELRETSYQHFESVSYQRMRHQNRAKQGPYIKKRWCSFKFFSCYLMGRLCFL